MEAKRDSVLNDKQVKRPYLYNAEVLMYLEKNGLIDEIAKRRAKLWLESKEAKSELKNIKLLSDFIFSLKNKEVEWKIYQG